MRISPLTPSPNPPRSEVEREDSIGHSSTVAKRRQKLAQPEADAPGYMLPCLRLFDGLLADVAIALCTVLFISSTSSVVAQDKTIEVAEEQEVVAIQAVGLAPAIQAREKDAPLEFLKPLFNSEISFIKRVCKPSDEQMTAIIAAATQAYNATGDMVSDPNQQLVVGNHFRFLGPGNEQLNQDPYYRVRRDAAVYLQSIVTDEQFARYQTESKQRDKFERKAVVGIYVGLINAKIPMTEQQQSEMNVLLMDEEDSLDIASVQVYVHNPQFLPKLPAHVADKVFNKKQLASWKSLNAGQLSFSSSVGNNPEMSIAEKWIK